MSILDKAAPAVRKETKYIAVSVLIGCIVMLIVFFILHRAMPEKVPFDYRVILGAVCGGVVAVANFFLMGLTVQKVAELTDDAQAQRVMKLSYSRRMLLQMGWVVVAIVAPCFQFAAGIIPLLFPGAAIKLKGVRDFSSNRNSGQ